MTRQDHLVTIVAEECVETAQRATKILRFGMDEIQPGQELNNAARLVQEFFDLSTVMYMLAEHDEVFKREYENYERSIGWSKAKKLKVEHFLEYSAQQGRLV